MPETVTVSVCKLFLLCVYLKEKEHKGSLSLSHCFLLAWLCTYCSLCLGCCCPLFLHKELLLRIQFRSHSGGEPMALAATRCSLLKSLKSLPSLNQRLLTPSRYSSSQKQLQTVEKMLTATAQKTAERLRASKILEES